MNRQLRQGDVLLVYVNEMPKDVKPVPKENGKVVLAHGEATGHAHTINRFAKFFEQDKTGKRFLRVSKTTTLDHQEHDTILLVPGIIEVRRQREYSPEAIRNVAD